ncbi:MAG: 2-phosphosulfolactate phosphatase [Actinomycetota bacterium]
MNESLPPVSHVLWRLMEFFDQHGYSARCEWGPEGAKQLIEGSDVIVVVDVISSTTCITIGVERGAFVFPYRFKDDSAKEFAQSLGATLAVHREDMNEDHPFSLSPGSFMQARPGDRIVLPSPNGATIALLAESARKPILAGCLRNATAVARAARSIGKIVTVIAAGERWFRSDDSLRPALEDQIGCGAILRSFDDRSPEANAAVAVFEAARTDLSNQVMSCASGREVAERGFAQDATIAAELDVSDCVPILKDGSFTKMGQ